MGNDQSNPAARFGRNNPSGSRSGGNSAIPVTAGRRVVSDGGHGNNRNRRRQRGNQSQPGPATLKVMRVDLKKEENSNEHHTSEYELSSPMLVLRRGQQFKIEVQFNREYKKTDDLRIVFEAGPDPDVQKGTQANILLSAPDKAKKWGAKIDCNEGKVLTVTIFTPADLRIGKWSMDIEVVTKIDSKTQVFSYEHPEPIVFIFNPWCKDDAVYLDKKEELDEYVLNESGRIFNGSANSISSKPWNFGQFEDHVLDVALELLDAGNLKWQVRGKPVHVARKLTAMVNSSDDKGVLTGNWSGQYSGGKSPLSWTGTPAIIQQYWDHDKKPVRYGQCWVFSGVTTTLMRAIGIPARSVTNFLSAHDTDGSITIDWRYTKEGEEIESTDSIWNFHVWNEVWMSRPDLPNGYGGWQVVDATPQETSDGVYVCGPASVRAIKYGEMNMPHDAPFVFAEVNADILYWQENYEGEFEPIGFYGNAQQKIGKFISTKKCGSDEREDITLNYKFAEGSDEERAAVAKANQTGSELKGVYSDTLLKDVEFSVKQDGSNTWVGNDFAVTLHLYNSSVEHRIVNGRVIIKTMFYTGVTSDKVLDQMFPADGLKIAPKTDYDFTVSLKKDDYLDFLKDGCMLDVSFWARVNQTDQVYSSKKNFRLRKPHLTIKAPYQAAAGQEFNVDISFVNPLCKTLTDCKVEVDGLAKSKTFPLANVHSLGTFCATLPITASKKGRKELILNFSSKELEDINGSYPIVITA